MNRRDVITVLGGTAVVWPLAAHAQQVGGVRRIGVLMDLVESDPQAQARIAALRQGLQSLGWTDGRNIRVDYRWSASDPGLARTYASELVALKPRKHYLPPPTR
jgi:putative ABC transport system substrate-binding protein